MGSLYAPCAHCKVRVANATRGLCHTCFRKPEVLEKYPRRVAYTARQGVGVGNGRQRPLPEKATDAQPGSEEKIEVLADRASAGRSLWHPDDLRAGPSSTEELSLGGRQHAYRTNCESHPQPRFSWLTF